MKIMAIGDIVGRIGTEYIKNNLARIKDANAIDLCIANGENSAPGNGITRKIAEELMYSGVDVITSGNHVFDKRDCLTETDLALIRPLNYPEGAPGTGYMCFEVNGVLIAVVNIMGRVFMYPLDCPFRSMDKMIAELRAGGVDLIIVDFHAEATSEKLAMGFYLDGRINALFGTHTHVQTSDEQILPNGTAYITDVGMTGPRHSVLGVKPDAVIKRFLTQIPCRFETSDNPVAFNSVVFTFDENFKTVSVQRVNY